MMTKLKRIVGKSHPHPIRWSLAPPHPAPLRCHGSLQCQSPGSGAGCSDPLWCGESTDLQQQRGSWVITLNMVETFRWHQRVDLYIFITLWWLMLANFLFPPVLLWRGLIVKHNKQTAVICLLRKTDMWIMPGWRHAWKQRCSASSKPGALCYLNLSVSLIPYVYDCLTEKLHSLLRSWTRSWTPTSAV